MGASIGRRIGKFQLIVVGHCTMENDTAKEHNKSAQTYSLCRIVCWHCHLPSVHRFFFFLANDTMLTDLL